MRFSITTVILILSSLTATAQPSPVNQPPPPQLHKVADSTYAIENANADMADLIYWGGNAIAYVTNVGVILVDSKFPRAHDDLVAKIKSVTDKPIKYVILTHHHGDHAGGAEQLENEGATVIISADDRDAMAHTPNQKWTPALGYVGHMSLILGGKEVDLIQMRGHTRGHGSLPSRLSRGLHGRPRYHFGSDPEYRELRRWRQLVRLAEVDRRDSEVGLRLCRSGTRPTSKQSRVKVLSRSESCHAGALQANEPRAQNSGRDHPNAYQRIQLGRRAVGR